MRARVVSDVPDATGRFRFAHVIVRDALYERLTSARRVWLHRHVLDTLESVYGDAAGPHLSELAHHAVAGRDFDRGVRYARAAGDRALRLLAYEEAARLYAVALGSLDRSARPDSQVRCQLLLSLGDAEVRAGNTEPAKRAFRDAAGIAQD